MKNAKNIFLTSITLAITLCSSIQVTAMEPEQTTNPQQKVNQYLDEQQKAALNYQISTDEKLFLDLFDPKKPSHPDAPWQDNNMRNYNAALLRAQINAYTFIYYDNKPYTDDEIGDVINLYTIQVKKDFGFK